MKNKNSKLILFFLAVFIFSEQIFAQENSSATSEKMILTVEEAVNYAKENSRTLQSANIDLQMKKRAKIRLRNICAMQMPLLCFCKDNHRRRNLRFLIKISWLQMDTLREV